MQDSKLGEVHSLTSRMDWGLVDHVVYSLDRAQSPLTQSTGTISKLIQELPGNWEVGLHIERFIGGFQPALTLQRQGNIDPCGVEPRIL